MLRDRLISRRAQRGHRRRAVLRALLWFVALASYSPAIRCWFFNAGVAAAAAEFRRPRRRVPRRVSFQMLGYASYLVPARPGRGRLALLLVPRARAAYTKAVGAVLLLPASRRCSLSPSIGSTSAARRSAPAAISATLLASTLTEYLNRTGRSILILVGAVPRRHHGRRRSRSAASCSRRGRRSAARLRCRAPGSSWRERRARTRRASRQRREVMPKHVEKGTEGAGTAPPKPRPAPTAERRGARDAAARDLARPPREPAAEPPHARATRSRSSAADRRCRSPIPSRSEGACRAQARRLHAAAAGAARPAAQRAQGGRARADGLGAPARGEVPRVLRRRQRRPDPSRARSSRPTSSSPTRA